MMTEKPEDMQNTDSSGMQNSQPLPSRPQSPPQSPPPRAEPKTPQKVIKPCEPAQIPKGFWKRIDYLLQNPDRFIESIRRDEDLGKICRVLFLISLCMAAIYGAVMGATNLLQGSELAMQYKMSMILISAAKVPVLFLLTLFIVLPPIYVSNAFIGAQLSFRQIMTVLMSAAAITVTILASMATVAFFFALTSRGYDFIKLLHVLFFAYAGIVGLQFLVKTIGSLASSTRRTTPQPVFLIWLLLYVFVGTQLAWVLRPFVGSPDIPFTVFREHEGNFYDSVGSSFMQLLQGDTRQQKR